MHLRPQKKRIVTICPVMEEVLHYQCFVHPSEYRITLKGRGFRPLVELVFRRGEPGHVDSDSELPKLFMGKDDYLRCVDMRRNESPIFVELQPESNQFYLRTADEPVGENE